MTSQRELDALRREDEALSAAVPRRARGLRGFADIRAVAQAVRAEGPELMSPAAAGWWDDQKRLYPHLGNPDRSRSIDGSHTRFGRASLHRDSSGRWWRRTPQGWIPEP